MAGDARDKIEYLSLGAITFSETIERALEEITEIPWGAFCPLLFDFPIFKDSPFRKNGLVKARD